MTKPRNEQNLQRLYAQPDRISAYFRSEFLSLLWVTLSGILYNVGLSAGPWFEGQLVQRLIDVSAGRSTLARMALLAAAYLLVILLVQAARAVKRFYVRRFANNTARSMRHVLYAGILRNSSAGAEPAGTGALMTKAVSDVDACVEGIRKFTTEIFDTGLALATYMGMLFFYDVRLALISCAFTPLAYLIAERLKTVVYRRSTAFKKSAGSLAAATLDRVSNAEIYRVFGREAERGAAYEAQLNDYEQTAVSANVLENTPQPLYNIIAMAGVVFILYFGAKNVAGTGWAAWDVAAFTTFLSCFAKLALKSSKAAKLFNSVQKAQVSWKRIKPLMQACATAEADAAVPPCAAEPLRVSQLDFAYPGGAQQLFRICFSAGPGALIGITGPVACGKSTLAGIFSGQADYAGSVKIGDRELRELDAPERSRRIAFTGHHPELLSDTLAENISLGGVAPVEPALACVCMLDEARAMPEGVDTCVGSGGVQLSGGQQARAALARAVYSGAPLLVLDDPFAAVDRKTEAEILKNLRALSPKRSILLFSHRVTEFPQCDQVIWMAHGRATVGTHASLLRDCPVYAEIYQVQTSGGDLDEKD